MKFNWKPLNKFICGTSKPNNNLGSTFNSKQYWNDRYLRKETSGSGSYGRLSLFKAEVINRFIKNNNIETVIELGSGDGNQLKLANYKDYIGFDVSSEAIKKCREIFRKDRTKTFKNYSNIQNDKYSAELVLSLDVIFHLIEEEIFNDYMKKLFALSSKYVIIYSCNHNEEIAAHVRCRKFTDWIDSEMKNEFRLLKFIPNKFPYDSKHPETTTFSDFYIYEKISK